MPSAQITGATPFADYRFRIQAKNQQGLSDWSDQSAAAQFNAPSMAPVMDHTGYGQFTVTNDASLSRALSRELGRSATVDYVGTNISGGGSFTHNGTGVITVSATNSRWKIEPVFWGNVLKGPHSFFERKVITSTGNGCHGPDHEVGFCGQCSTCCGCYNEQGCWCAAGFNPPTENPPPAGFVKKHGEWSKVNA